MFQIKLASIELIHIFEIPEIDLKLARFSQNM